MLAFFFMIVVAVTTAATAWMMESVVDDVVVDNDPARVRVIAFIVKRLYRHILSQDLAFHQRMQAGDLVTHMSTNATAVRNALEIVITSVGRDLLTVIALVAVMFIKDPLISLITLIIAPIAIFGIGYLVRRVKSVARAQFTNLASIVTGMQETATGVRVIKAFNLEGKMTERMDTAIGNVENRTNRMAVLDARSSPIMETLGGFAEPLLHEREDAGVLAIGDGAIRKSRTPRAMPMPKNSSSPCAVGMTRPWGRMVITCPADSASGLRLRGRCCAMRRSCCSTRRPRRWTRNRRPRCKRRWSG